MTTDFLIAREHEAFQLYTRYKNAGNSKQASFWHGIAYSIASKIAKTL